jgi:ABC-type phosphate transport system permease subunit
VTKLTRALIAVVLGLLFALSVLRPAADLPGVRALPPELRVLAGVPCLVIRIFTGDF